MQCKQQDILAHQFAAPAAMIQTLINGTICTCLPLWERWVQTYASDPVLCAGWDLALNPSKVTFHALSKVNHNYCRPLRKSLISIRNNMLIYKNLLQGHLPLHICNWFHLSSSISFSSPSTPIPLAVTVMHTRPFIASHWNVLICKMNVSGMSRLCIGQSYLQQILKTCVQFSDWRAVLGYVLWHLLSWQLRKLWGIRMLLDQRLWYLWLCLNGTHHESVCHYLCVCLHENTVVLWILSHYCRQQGQQVLWSLLRGYWPIEN